MTTRQYFTASLGLPVVLGLLGYVFEPLSILWLGLVAGCIVYVPLAVITGIRLRRVSSTHELGLVGLVLPIVFSLLFGFLYFVLGYLDAGFGALPVAFIATLVAAVVGYGYVLIACIGWQALRRLGVVHNELAA
jgi:hypothetical protein